MGTPFVLYRKDKVTFVRGTEKLRAYRLKPGAPTRRVVTACCGTPLFLEFESGHWLSLYGALWPEAERPAMQIRTMTGDLPDEATLEPGPPSGRRVTLGFYLRLLGAWIAMGLRAPKVEVPVELDLPARPADQ